MAETPDPHGFTVPASELGDNWRAEHHLARLRDEQALREWRISCHHMVVTTWKIQANTREEAEAIFHANPDLAGLNLVHVETPQICFVERITREGSQVWEELT